MFSRRCRGWQAFKRACKLSPTMWNASCHCQWKRASRLFGQSGKLKTSLWMFNVVIKVARCNCIVLGNHCRVTRWLLRWLTTSPTLANVPSELEHLIERRVTYLRRRQLWLLKLSIIANGGGGPHAQTLNVEESINVLNGLTLPTVLIGEVDKGLPVFISIHRLILLSVGGFMLCAPSNSNKTWL